MKGFQITFFTQQDRMHRRKPVAEWLMMTAKEIGIRGATIVAAAEGFGHDRRIHSAHFFELADQPQEVVMAVTEDEAERMFEVIRRDGVRVFYVKTAIEFGVLGDPNDVQS